jgi:calcineurin-like phosphoesterase family protein
MVHEIFLIADTHFGHKNILNFEAKARPFATIEEHNEALVENWNKVVRPQDKVYHLGDVAFGNNLHYIKRCNGRKRLVLGNHDTKKPDEYFSVGFEKIFGAVVRFDERILTHIPVHPMQMDRFKCNIHGHTHSTNVDGYPYWNVSCEQIGLTPIAWDDLKKRYE